MISGMMTVDGVRLECRRLGTPSGRRATLVFLHDGLGCVDIWRDFPGRLTERTGLPGFVYSRAGYGRSDPILLPRPLDYLHNEALQVLPAVLDAAGIDRPILVGHSDGATISLIYGGAADAPWAEAIIALAPHVFNEEISVRSIRDMIQEYESGTLRAKLERYHGSNVECAFRGWSGAWVDPHFRSWTVESLLAGIEVPVLVMQGKADGYGSLTQVTSILENVSGPVQARVIPRCGHVPYREMPEITLKTIAQFVQDL
jgi:pimeloyl-ACP methyl ester carboxylesterase